MPVFFIPMPRRKLKEGDVTHLVSYSHSLIGPAISPNYSVESSELIATA